jgi:hypothetical protein
MLKKTMMTAAAAVLMFNVNTLTASAYSPMPEVSATGAGKLHLQQTAATRWRTGVSACRVASTATGVAVIAAATSGLALPPASLALAQLPLPPMLRAASAAMAVASALNGAARAGMAGKPGAGSGAWTTVAANPR